MKLTDETKTTEQAGAAPSTTLRCSAYGPESAKVCGCPLCSAARASQTDAPSASVPEFGRKPPAGYAGPAWGARAIYQSREIDIVGNRQGFAGPQGKPRAALLSWVNRTALPAMRKLVASKGLDTTTNEVLTFESRGYHMEACPQASHGYLYLGAWKLEAPAAAEPTLKGETFLVICHEAGAWGRGSTLVGAVEGMLAGMSKPSLTAHYDVRRFWWASPEDREAARRFDAARAAEGLPSWVEADGRPCVLVLTDGTVQRASLMASEDVIRGGRWDRKTCTVVARSAPLR